MKKIILASTLSSIALLFTACASNPKHSLAIQKENNQFEVTGIGKSNLIAKNNAISAAQQTCSKNTTPVIVDEKTTYNGVLKDVVSEKTGKMVEAAAGVLGTITGTSASLSKDDDYQSTLTFYCKIK